MAQQIWGQRHAVWEDQAGAVSGDRREGMLGGCCDQQEKLLSGKTELILMTQNTSTK